jgi:hypothetical protein
MFHWLVNIFEFVVNALPFALDALSLSHQSRFPLRSGLAKFGDIQLLAHINRASHNKANMTYASSLVSFQCLRRQHNIAMVLWLQ